MSRAAKLCLVVSYLLLTPVAVGSALPPKLGVQPIFPDFLMFRGDDQWHAEYTLILTNYTKTELKISSVSVHGFANQGEIYTKTYTAADLPAMFSSVKGNYELPQQPLLGPGESGVLYFLLDFALLSNIPQTIENNFLVSAGGGETTEISIAPLQRRNVDPEVVRAPLQGSQWWTPNGPSNDAVHRRTLVVVGGKLSLTEEFAVDWVRLGDNGATFSGDSLKNQSYLAYNQDVLAAASGRIIKVRDGIAENKPTQNPPAEHLDLETLAGNHIVQDFGDGRYALYAHLIPGSLRVHVGDVVVQGEVLGRLGNSGNSTQPHLHFHVMDGPEPLGPRGVPFYIASWLRVPHKIVCGPNAKCDPTDGPTNLLPGTPVRVQQQAFMNWNLGAF